MTGHDFLIQIGVGENRIFKLAGGPRDPWLTESRLQNCR
jgi:hypothetical protein